MVAPGSTGERQFRSICRSSYRQTRLYAGPTSKRQYPKLPGESSLRSTTATPFGKLAVTHGISVCGDVFFTVALANSLFFSAASSEARTKVLLYLLLTLAPFALVAPFLGRLLDRSRGGRRLLMVLINLLRGVVAFVLANHINDALLYPLALVALALSKSQGITNSALVPALVDDQSELVLANSRLTLLSVVGGVVAAPVAGGILKLLGGAWVLRAGAVVFIVAVIVPPSGSRRPASSPRTRRRRRRRCCTSRASCRPAPRWASCAASWGS